ncbi:hypothetical protein GW17_00053172 [Ensete ventricosum]|nr:hypothetical protein GW17_00053172 [Ensete ventricosum]
MTNSLVRIGTVEGEWVKRALASLIRPSSHHQRRRADFRPRPSRLSQGFVACVALPTPLPSRVASVGAFVVVRCVANLFAFRGGKVIPLDSFNLFGIRPSYFRPPTAFFRCRNGGAR